ncbi:molybdenum cofactor guanylyltransferase MobA [Dokdonella fugitiva]|jgi:molybdenum cofactor guanylyltransferase|uniref:molybdenum cofactor guanylyltransferase MobA n=1 Tax=Dokdonella fugitiva TaxID=328517 RepID=UPI0015F91910|nr:molybdenum cofactor guanylyltransferase MobA [Dokdonella fugitiva]MBA8883358.1 molybdenum cofactor guanylyltransferase [Dokdonella fugitiva]
MTARPAITAAILAGGAGRRLGGRDKGLEPLAGVPLVEHVLAALQGVDARLIVANRNHDVYSRYARTVADTVDRHGPLAGIAAACAACETPWLLTVPVDCPEPPVDLATRLLREALLHDAPAVVAHDGTTRQPLFALYRRELADAAAAAAAAAQGVWAWQDAIGARELDFADRGQQFQNLNTPDDFLAHASRPHSTD